MYLKFIRAIQKIALANVPEQERDYLLKLTEISSKRSSDDMKDIIQPQGPGIDWTVELLMSAYEKNYKNRVNCLENGLKIGLFEFFW